MNKHHCQNVTFIKIERKLHYIKTIGNYIHIYCDGQNLRKRIIDWWSVNKQQTRITCYRTKLFEMYKLSKDANIN